MLDPLPTGTWVATDMLDSTGPVLPVQVDPAALTGEVQHRQTGADRLRSSARLHLSLSVERDPVTDMPRITFDFTGTDRQVPGNMNAVRAVTVSAVGFALRAALDPTLPANAGVMEPVRVLTSAGSLVDAVVPVAVGAGNVEVSQRVADLCQATLAQAVPERVPAAGQGTMNNVLLGSVGGGGDRTPWVYYETIGGGQGGRPLIRVGVRATRSRACRRSTRT
ncbi:MAG: hydantoinase B/oxoprolinase family protein [Microthrixaceae bacterium]|nr:hydantoinase B/oxoprolinase family protein [Microthrixaceae bacterium]